ncbi:unnamed protein product, partial [Prorocentrum cordatum]
RPVLASLLAAALVALGSRSASFVGSPVPGCQRGGRVIVRVSAEYLERCGPKDADIAFEVSAAIGPGPTVTYKKRPFGILRYQPGNGMKGAMAMEVIPVSRYPGDPQGQAFAAGVAGGMVVKSIAGAEIMDLLDDEVADPRFSKSTALALEKMGRMADPMKADGQDGFAR